MYESIVSGRGFGQFIYQNVCILGARGVPGTPLETVLERVLIFGQFSRAFGRHWDSLWHPWGALGVTLGALGSQFGVVFDYFWEIWGLLFRDPKKASEKRPSKHEKLNTSHAESLLLETCLCSELLPFWVHVGSIVTLMGTLGPYRSVFFAFRGALAHTFAHTARASAICKEFGCPRGGAEKSRR